MKEDILKVITYYGVLPQLKYFQSEVYELNEAIIQYENIPNGIYGYIKDKYKVHIAEEIADVTFMLKQFQLYYEILDIEIKEIMGFKINRQLERISKEDE